MFFVCIAYIHSSQKGSMNRIKEVLEQKGIKQVWLADQLGKSYNIVNGYVVCRQINILFNIKIETTTIR